VTYSCDEVHTNKLVCKWKNDHGASGDQDLIRVGSSEDDTETP
jgi:hypothetical protein